MELWNKYKTLLNENGINTSLRLSHFFAQIEHESELKVCVENLNYSAEGLTKTFKKYFPTLQFAKLYERNPQKIANKVYSSRMGNGTEQSGDGWKYRGRGFIQLTGKDNYLQASKDLGIDFVGSPDLALLEANAMILALWFWNKNKINVLADKDDVIGVTKKINGGTIGLEHRKQLLLKYKKYFGA